MNRTPPSSSLYSPWTRNLPDEEKVTLYERLWLPYRTRLVEEVVDGITVGKRIVHLSVHSFTPVWKGKERSVDVGILDHCNDPYGRLLADRWRAELLNDLPGKKICRNRPYRGHTDSRVSELRSMMPKGRYVGLELEVSQTILQAADARRVCKAIAASYYRSLLGVFRD
jgi:predicted N-formylglutamate amidohydrolase